MNKAVEIFLFLILVALLVSIRVFEELLFYDPLINYFKSDYLSLPIPKINLKLFFLNIFYRYTLNSVFSLGIIFLGFKSLKNIQFSVKIYLIVFVILNCLLFILLSINFNMDYKLIFYVRRFLIHPLLLLILIPAFYYQRLKINK
jgi:exosortase F-associated protein